MLIELAPSILSQHVLLRLNRAIRTIETSDSVYHRVDEIPPLEFVHIVLPPRVIT